MKRCPTCQHTYADQTIKFCRYDGTPLTSDLSLESSETLILPTAPQSADILTYSLQNTTSIAVLPFVNISADQENEFFCDGLAEELINVLTKIETLHVAARTSAFSFKGSKVDAREIGRRLNVGTILEGSVRKAGDRLRITAQLINAADGYQLWSERYDRRMDDIFDIQDEISLAIVDALKVKLLGEEKAALLKRRTESKKAYECYLKGRFYWNKRTVEGLKKGVEYFRQAIDIDPGYAAAYAGLSDSYIILSAREELSLEDGFAKAKVAATTALKIDDTLAEAHASLAHAMLHHWDWTEAEREFQRAFELNPNYPSAHHWYSEYLLATSRFEEAIAEVKRAQELDPLSLIINQHIADILYRARRYDESIEQSRKTLEMDSNFWLSHLILGEAYGEKGMYEEAIAEIQRASDLSEESPEVISLLGYTYAKMGQKDEARNMIDNLGEWVRGSFVPSFFIAKIHAGLGEKDQAFEWLEKAYEKRAYALFTLNVDPQFDSLRSDLRFTDLVRRIGLMP